MQQDKSAIRYLTRVIRLLLFGFYIFFLYELLVIPAVLDWSLYGILLSIALFLFMAWAIPKAVRIRWLVLAVTFLMAVKSLNNLQDSSLAWQVAGSLIIFGFLAATSILAGKVHLGQFSVIFALALMLTYTVDRTEIPYWSEFSVKWKSPLLYPKQTSVDYFPVQVLDVDNDGTAEIITQGNLAEAEQYIMENVTAPLEPLEAEQNNLLVYKWTGNGFSPLEPGQYNITLVLDSLTPDYINLPYYSAKWSFTKNKEPQQKLQPLFTKTELIEMAGRFGLVPFTSLEATIENVIDRKNSFDRLSEKSGVAEFNPLTMDYEQTLPVNNETAKNVNIEGPLLAGQFEDKVFSGQVEATGIMAGGQVTARNQAAVLLGKDLQVISIAGTDAGSVVGKLTAEEIEDIGTSEVFLADVNGDQIDELLLNTERAKILQLKNDGKWKVLWNSQDDSLRFEDFATLGNSNKPVLICLSKSLVRNNKTRYLTGYELTPEGLTSQWRVFTGPINLQAADVDGDNENELVGYGYRNHRLYVLEKHNIPVTQILYGITGLFAAYGIYRQITERKKPGEVS